MMQVKQKNIAKLNGKDVALFRIVNSRGSYVELINYGATLVSLVVPDRTGKLENVVLGFSDFDGYLHDDCYIGSTIGRYANRIGNASLRIGEKKFQLDKNDNCHSNHGGFAGFHSKVFETEIQNDRICFHLYSEDGEGGFPGNLKFSVLYQWNDRHELRIKYQAISDQDTAVNFTNHAYFNLSALQENGLNQELTIAASTLVDCTPEFIPTGAIIPTEALTFNQQKIGDKINWEKDGMKGVNSYYILDRLSITESACLLYNEKSGRQLEIFTTYPGVQLYTGDFLSSKRVGNHGTFYQPFDGICLECQYYPDSPNHQHFPSTLVKAGEKYSEEIIYRFGIKM